MPEDTQALCKNLYFWAKKQGISLEGIPGFYRGKNGYWDLKKPGEGYLCPVFDGNLITGFQIRMDNPLNGAKYLWLSSSNYRNGVGSGSPSTFLKGKNEQCIIVVEGVLKATVVYCLLKGEVTVIGCPGIKVISGIYPFLKRYSKKSYIIEAYDMDKYYQEEHLPLLKEANDLIEKGIINTYMDLCTKEHEKHFHELVKVARIAAAAEDLCKKVEEYELSVHSLTWDVSGSLWKGKYKGLDDFLQAFPSEKRDLFVKEMIKKADKNLKMKAFFAQ